ncbi:serine/threonine-protein phosphatase 1 regulatory subunit 10-like [Centruroides sculpturatus]|uniref:serine/threonine-protein phosphatase 1 regulatory subunit 10-like n=1 Tax=Centruroides sculpturatus TaxID=218467 RepID=UPI000C6DD8C0|nr:serine/threonine-protein phosphatase 1 regulatory subunit 10-like [Centruroides sculpturatus]
MKKFSRKLVSRCVYCNVLRATQPDVLTTFLNESGWDTINKWLQDARTIENHVFLLELLRLCQILPMTVDRLKQNNTAKIIKTLTKSEDQDVKTLALDVVNAWMSLIKGERSENLNSDKMKKKKKKDKEEKDIKEKVKENKDKYIKSERLKRENSDDNLMNKYEDVVIKMPLDEEPLIKKPKLDRPKTVKTYQAKFRSTGLEENTPLPKDVTKKIPTINRSEAVAAAKNAVKKMNTPKDLPYGGKKIKPASLITPENSHANVGLIKLIPPKPKPIHILQESASFVDALVSAPTQPIRRKKKNSSGKPPTPTTPPSPVNTPPKLQFYKDTLEMSSETTEEKEEEDKDKEEPKKDETNHEDDDEEKSDEPALNAKDIDSEKEEIKPRKKSENGQLCSILIHGKRREKKKSVRWAEESELKQVFHFEMDETERVNVNHVHNFGDLKSMEIKRERKAFETARRLMGDKMQEAIPWAELIPIDLPATQTVERGYNSREKDIQMVHQQSTLQDIYFSRDMLPDSPHEPEQEIVNPQEPKTIPLEDDNNPGNIMDYSMSELPPPKMDIPPVLSNLMMSISNQDRHPQLQMEQTIEQIIQSSGFPNHHSHTPPGSAGPPSFNPLPTNHYVSENEMPDWDPGMMPPDQYGDQFYGNHPGNMPGMMGMPLPPRGVRPRMMPPPPVRVPMPDIPPPPRGRGPRPMGPPPRMRGPPRVPCKHFMASGCRYGSNCLFLHPGVNGPPL